MKNVGQKIQLTTRHQKLVVKLLGLTPHFSFISLRKNVFYGGPVGSSCKLDDTYRVS